MTFDAAPPQINEYEMTTPDPSSVASGSREGSYESADNEEEDSFERGSSIERDDSFDESLEDTDKTPVVLPEDWRFMSPATANDDLATHIENPFNGPQPSMRDFRLLGRIQQILMVNVVHYPHYLRLLCHQFLEHVQIQQEAFLLR